MKKIPWSCKCGRKRDQLNRNSEDKCTRCFTFSADHLYVGDFSRCDLCNTRVESHR